MSDAAAYTSHFFTSVDGLKLHLRSYGDAGSAGMPVVCVPGLARTSGDFDALARELSKTRRVVAIDYRGRGLSDYDPNWRNYNVPMENGDLLNVLTAVGIDKAIFVGTSRGGLHTMALAATRPGIIHAAVLNDIGPVIELIGLTRIRGYVGKLPSPKNWTDAVDLFKKVSGAHFTSLSDAEWEIYARLTFQEKDGKFVAQYDPALMNGLAELDFEKELPTLWAQFDGLRDVPLMVIRGSNSDLLSQATYEAMLARHPGSEGVLVEGQGHAPLLIDAPTIGRIAAFVARVDAKAS